AAVVVFLIDVKARQGELLGLITGDWQLKASEMFSDAVLDHFRNPRNAGELPDATATVEVTNPVCGDILKLFARFESGRIAEARFLCRGCTTAIACASLVTEQLSNITPAEVRAITADSLPASLGGLPEPTFHVPQHAAPAVVALPQILAALS